MTVMHQWWGELIWPNDMDVGEARRRFGLAVELIRQASGKRRPMAWLTTRLKQELEGEQT